MNNVVHLHERQITDDFIGYTSGITGSQSTGPCSIAYLLTAPDGSELAKESINTSIVGTGHDAEYLAVTLLSRVVRSRFAYIKNLSIFCSDQLVVNQLSGQWRIQVEQHQQFVKKIHFKPERHPMGN